MHAMPPIRRQVKNVVYNYTEAQKKVREATSNDPWGPSSTVMGEIADLTYNIVAFTEIMQMIWKRLNDHGKNWRHVYKALVLLDYLIKTGTEKVAQQCKENLFAIQTLKDFQYIEENKDQGMNVREKAKQLVSLLQDDERLKNERARALKAKERFKQNSSGIGPGGVTFGRGPGTHGGHITHSEYGSPTSSPSHATPGAPELEAARPQTAGEEELQLQLALAISKEEAEQTEKMKKGDDLRLQMALNESRDDDVPGAEAGPGAGPPPAADSLLDLDFSAAGGAVGGSNDPWSSPVTVPSSDPWQATQQEAPPADPWAASQPPPAADPWAPAAVGGGPSGRSNGELDEFDTITSTRGSARVTNGNNPFDFSTLGGALGGGDDDRKDKKKTPEEFLGENKNLVNLDSLVSKPTTDSTNPFAVGLATAKNPFHEAPKVSVPMNQLRTSPSSFQGGQQQQAGQEAPGGYNPFI